jgi:hypothetical protein
LDINSNKEWSKMHVRDLKASVACGAAIDETAQHLCRGIEETKAKGAWPCRSAPACRREAAKNEKSKNAGGFGASVERATGTR